MMDTVQSLPDRKYRGSCLCGTVEVTLVGEPVAMGCCDCESCRAWSDASNNGFMLWKPNAVEITRGADQLATYSKTPCHLCWFCKRCGGHMLAEHAHWDLIDVFAASVPSFPFTPSAEVNHHDSVPCVHETLTLKK
jgi:hypothetical protein